MSNQYDEIITKYRFEEGNIISLLQDTQNKFGFIPQDAIFYFARTLEIPVSQIYGVATFYSQFYLKPRGKNRITVCRGTACHVKGSERILMKIKKEIGLDTHEDTTAGLEFSVDEVACVGACSIAPVVIINNKMYGKSSPDRLIKEIKAIMK
ncbi:MAG: NAD(P)H-dependent oxidoreductase subunit E [Thermodesulfovibrionales bacterium]|nr:NAD(P)H-dependent oxidoreductase subunit E [Thermodesulfovibrionales bacterium]